MSLSIIIVNYRTPKLVCDCLNSLTGIEENLSEFIVVDNNSGDDSKEIICGAFPKVKWIQMDYNSGFARANNEGIRQCSGDIVLLLNSDTLDYENGVVNTWMAFQSSQYVACGVQLLNADLTPQISGNFFMRGGLNNLLPLPYIGNFIKWLGNVAKVKKPHVASTDAETRVDWINGAFIMVKKSAIEQVGLLDEDFFLYAEEAEWCARLGKAGKMAIYGQYKVIHLQGESSNATFKSSGKGYYNLYDRKGLQIMLSNFVRIRKQYGVIWFIFHLIMYTLTIPIYFMGELLRKLSGKRNEGNSSAIKFCANVFRVWRFTFVIIRNKPYFYKVL